MSTYYVHRYADLSRAIHDGATTDDAIHILGDIPVSAAIPPLDYWVHPGGVLSIASTGEASIHIDGGHLRIVGSGPLALQLYGTDTPGGQVTLVGCSPSDVRSVERIGAPYGWDVQADIDLRDLRGDVVSSPEHYTWLGEAIVARGGPEHTGDLQSWDILDAIAPDDPHVWNALKYLTRLGRKGGAANRIVDLRKARAYLDRAISQEERDSGAE